jgi:NAD(P)-dependent dehydrogenase (short-subunit alcohol dehydrogenase family)
LNKIVLITGVNGGIGSAAAKLFAKKGWHVIGIDNRKVELPPWIHHFIKADVSNTRAWEKVSTEIAKREGRIDALINNAAIQICKPIIKTTPEEWDTVMATNLRSVYLSIYYLHSLMHNHGGAIVNVSSVHAIATSSNIAAYAASKGALVALTRALAIELAPDQIRVNSVLPGAVDTQMLREGLKRGHLVGTNNKELIYNLAERTVIGRIGKTQEIAQAIFFLTEEKRSSFITGQSLVVDGGATAKLSTE